jgi:hypothetical protein
MSFCSGSIRTNGKELGEKGRIMPKLSWVRLIRIVPNLIPIGFVCIVLIGAYAQPPNLEPNHPGFKVVPTISFERVYPNATPAHYAISVDSSGNAAYQSEDLGHGARQELATGEPYIVKFTISDATSLRIFNLARQAKYFKRSSGAGNRLIPNTGTITLTYAEGPVDSFGHSTNGVRNSITYNKSTNPAIRQLTKIFEGISNSIQLGRQIEYLRRTSQPALDDALKSAENRARAHRIIELQAIIPSLKNVADDPSVSDFARQHARRLIQLAQSSPEQ